MILRLYLDECAYSKYLRNVLLGEPYRHYVETPADAGIRGRADSVHLAYARDHDLILVTKDPDDFKRLHRQNPSHPGIFVIYQNGDSRDLTNGDVGQAIQNLVGHLT